MRTLSPQGHAHIYILPSIYYYNIYTPPSSYMQYISNAISSSLERSITEKYDLIRIKYNITDIFLKTILTI